MGRYRPWYGYGWMSLFSQLKSGINFLPERETFFRVLISAKDAFPPGTEYLVDFEPDDA